VRSPILLALVASTCALGATPLVAQVYTRTNANGVVEATNVPDSGGFLLTYPGKGTLIHSRGFHHASYSGEYDHHIEAAARLHQVSPDLVRAVIAAESEFDQWAVSSKGAQGLMQLMPETARRFGVADAFDARQNIFAGTHYLRLLLDLFQGDVALALAAYNAGENAVRRYGGIPPYRETRGYVPKIQALLGGGSSDSGGKANAASFFVPTARFPVSAARPRTAPRSRRVEPARPRIYYRWRDEGGHPRVGTTPPAEGTVYSMIRALE
jgi:soluble lytic murein transglycosylase-like protein